MAETTKTTKCLPLHPAGSFRYVARAGLRGSTVGRPVVITEARDMGRGLGFRYLAAGLWFYEDDLTSQEPAR